MNAFECMAKRICYAAVPLAKPLPRVAQLLQKELISGGGTKKTRLKERVYSEMKTSERLDYCPHIQPIRLIFPKSAPTFHVCVSVSKICTSGDPLFKGRLQHKDMFGLKVI